MLVTCLIAMASSQGRGSLAEHARKLDHLARARMSFENKVVEDASESGLEDHIYSMPLDQTVFGYYPIGKSNERCLAYIDNSWKSLQYQKIVRNHAKRMWRIELVERKGKEKYRGTLALVLLRHGVQPKEPVSKLAQQALNQKLYFAAYGYSGPAGSDLSAWMINSDGALGLIYDYGEITTDKHIDYLPIVPEESAALGLGNQGWSPKMKAVPSK
jgi:hypothetical protein